MTRDKDSAEDLTQNVFYKAIRYRTSYNGGKFVSWIFKIARNNLADHYQKSQRTKTNIEVESLGDLSMNGEYDGSEDVAHLYQALNLLKTDEKELIVMNRLQGIRYDQIAEITNSTEGAIKVKVHRIIKKLRDVYFETI